MSFIRSLCLLELVVLRSHNMVFKSLVMELKYRLLIIIFIYIFQGLLGLTGVCQEQLYHAFQHWHFSKNDTTGLKQTKLKTRKMTRKFFRYSTMNVCCLHIPATIFKYQIKNILVVKFFSPRSGGAFGSGRLDLVNLFTPTIFCGCSNS